VSGDDLASLLYLATSHPDEFIRAACAARSLELRGRPVTAAAVARTAKIDDWALAGEVADLLTERKPLRYRDRRGRWKTDDQPGAARRSVTAGVVEGELELGPYGLHRAAPRG
jgi:hypothetical protein